MKIGGVRHGTGANTVLPGITSVSQVTCVGISRDDAPFSVEDASAMFVRVTVASRVTSDDVNGELLRAETTRSGPGWMRAHVVSLPTRTLVRERLKVLPGRPGSGVDSGFG